MPIKREHSLLKKLCRSLVKDKRDLLNYVYENAIGMLTAYDQATLHTTSYSSLEEFGIKDRIKQQLAILHPSSSNVENQFDALYKQLTILTFVKNRACILLFLSQLSDSDHIDVTNIATMNRSHVRSKFSPAVNSSTTYSYDDASSMSMSTISMSISTLDTMQNAIENTNVADSSMKDTRNIHLLSDTPICFGSPLATSSSNRKMAEKCDLASKRKTVEKCDLNFNSPILNLKNGCNGASYSHHINRPTTLKVSSHPTNTYHPEKDVVALSENEIIRELLFCMQGVEGNTIKLHPVAQEFVLDPSVRLHEPHLVLHLMELGYLHRKVKKYVDNVVKKQGTIVLGFTNSMRKELTAYYEELASIDIQIEQQLTMVPDTPMSEENQSPTLKQLFIWSRKHMTMFKCLASVVACVEGNRGGELLSCLSDYIYHGNLILQRVLKNLFSAAMRHLYMMICNWMVSGELTDIYDEFFIQFVPNVEEEDVWDMQFQLRCNMVPKFLPVERANQILQTGRYIHFLNNVCSKRPPLTKAQMELKIFAENDKSDMLGLLYSESEICTLIQRASVSSSKLVLHSLKEDFHLYMHLEALRKYMLLGQGDFLHCLMEMLEPDLNKEATSLRQYDLVSILESAIRSTTAQYDSPEVLNRLQVKLLEVLKSENGWDAFSLAYNTEGPLNTIFKLSDGRYNRVFTFLWRIKRSEYFLSRVWRDLKLLHKKAIARVPDIGVVFVSLNWLTMQMVQFINHFQYYTAFEVVEVSWQTLKKAMEKMESLDEMLDAHNNFITSIHFRCMLTDMKASCNIRIVLDTILEMISVVERFVVLTETELARRIYRKENIEKHGTSNSEECKNDNDITRFRTEMRKMKTSLKMISGRYEQNLYKVLEQLYASNDQNLQLLANRMDFNSFYTNNKNNFWDPILEQNLSKLNAAAAAANQSSLSF